MGKIQVEEAAQSIKGDGLEARLRVTITCISEMRGAYPDIALPGDIDRAALGEDAFFVTLPIGQVGAKSRNARRYSRAAVEQMVAQINAQRPEGMWGHVAESEAQTRYDPPAIRWLAAALDAEGVAWGKGLPLTAETREYYRLAKATNARVGTSLVAWAQMDGDEVKALELVTVDLADPARVGVAVTAAKPVISKEMGAVPSTEYRVPSKNSEMGAGTSGDLAALREMLGASEADVVARVRALLDEQSAWIVERAALKDAAITAAVARAVRVPAAQRLVEELVRVRQPQNGDEIAAAVAAVVESEAVQTVLRAGVSAAMGPAQRRPVRREGEGAGFFSF